MSRGGERAESLSQGILGFLLGKLDLRSGIDQGKQSFILAGKCRGLAVHVASRKCLRGFSMFFSFFSFNLSLFTHCTICFFGYIENLRGLKVNTKSTICEI